MLRAGLGNRLSRTGLGRSLSASVPRQQGALVLLALVYLAIALGRSCDAFWSPDQGGKMLQVLALLDGRGDLSIAYPGRALDPGLAFRPYPLSYVLNGGIHLPWLMAWALPSAFLYAVLGSPGLLVLPVAGGLLAAWAAGRLAESIAPGSGWPSALLTGAATPMLVFSTLFWEHAPAAGFFGAGLLALLTGPGSGSRVRWFLAGCCFGLAVAWRNEACIYVVAAVAASHCLARQARRLTLLALGLGLILVPTGAYNWLTTGSVAMRATTFPESPARVFRTVVRDAPSLPADLLVGRPVPGTELPELVHWAPAGGLVLLLAALRASERWKGPLRWSGLVLAGSASAALLVSDAPQTVHGFLIAAPFLAVVLLAPRALSTSPTGRFLLLFVAVALPLYAGASPIMHVDDVAGGGLEWGPRYLLPVYPPSAALAAVVLVGPLRSRPRAEQVLAGALIFLGVTFQVAGLARIDLGVHRMRTYGGLIASLAPGPVVIRPNNLVMATPGLTRGRAVFCVGTPAALGRWAEMALQAGEQEFWYTDTDPLPRSWIRPGGPGPDALAEVEAGEFRATRYRTAAVQAVLRPEGPDRETCR